MLCQKPYEHSGAPNQQDAREGDWDTQRREQSSLTPYPGLRPFEQDEWPIFFGRERITRDIVDRLTATKIVVIHGGSGCGKSSFVRAGVLAQLDRECAREGWQCNRCDAPRQFSSLEPRRSDRTHQAWRQRRAHD